MLAESLLKNRVLEAVCEKNGKPRAPQGSGERGSGGRDVLWASGVPVPWACPRDVWVSRASAIATRAADGEAAEGALRRASAIWLPTDRGAAEAGRMEGRKAAHPATASGRRAARAPEQAEGRAPRSLHGAANQGDAPRACVDVGLHRRCDDARRSIEDAEHS